MAEETQAAESTPETATVTETKNTYDGAEIRGARREESKETKAPEVEKHPGYNPIDVETAAPEQVKERLNYLYRQVKDGNKTVNQYRQVAAEQSRQIEELTKGFNGVVNHLQTKSLDDNEEALTQLMNTAFEKGDNKGYLDAQKKLIKLGVDKEILTQRQTQSKQTQQQPVQQQRNYDAASRIADDAASEGVISSEDARLTEAWQNEKDENGNQIRPWSKTANAEHPDPLYTAALREAQAVFTNKRFENLTHEEKLAEIDRRMGTPKRVTAQTVTGGGLNGRGKVSKVTLSADIEKMVLRTKWGGSKHKTDEERLSAYRQQLVKVRGARK